MPAKEIKSKGNSVPGKNACAKTAIIADDIDHISVFDDSFSTRQYV